MNSSADQGLSQEILKDVQKLLINSVRSASPVGTKKQRDLFYSLIQRLRETGLPRMAYFDDETALILKQNPVHFYRLLNLVLGEGLEAYCSSIFQIGRGLSSHDFESRVEATVLAISTVEALRDPSFLLLSEDIKFAAIERIIHSEAAKLASHKHWDFSTYLCLCRGIPNLLDKASFQKLLETDQSAVDYFARLHERAMKDSTNFSIGVIQSFDQWVNVNATEEQRDHYQIAKALL